MARTQRAPHPALPRRHLLALLAMVAGFGRAASAQEPYPTRAVRIIVPFPPGGPTDVIARILAEMLSSTWKQPVVVENRGGGGTIVGTVAVAQAAPDGYTFGIATNPFVFNPALRHNLPYDTLRDFTAVGMLMTTPIVLVAPVSFPPSNLAELLDYAKRSPAPLAYASPGPGGIGHMAGELLQREAQLTLEHIPYSGSAPALTDVIAGRVPLMFDLWNSVRPHVESGRLKVLGVAGSSRIEEAPQYATIAETFPAFASTAFPFNAVIMPAGVPKPLLDKISADVRAIVVSPQYADRLKPLGAVPAASTAAELEAFFRREIPRWQAFAREANITLD
ncbi:Bug family tripartite tricarboxylate transporter substrate binding protein [Roseomonas sp. BN140053]|uniref:Bug family tripartite tricarboxylate transporter substrate binding protein n=1 Tax=Roseomonas sp. BN140053 TaxID=3391898 RepID=UPI0039EC41A5